MTRSGLVAAALVITCGAQSTLLASAQSSMASSWERVKNMRPGTKLHVKGYGTRFFVSADDSALYVVNSDHPQMPRVVNAALKEVIGLSPNSLLVLPQNAILNLSRNVRLERGGIFVTDEKVSELNAVFETIPRATVGADAITKKKSSYKKQLIVVAIIAAAVLWAVTHADG